MAVVTVLELPLARVVTLGGKLVVLVCLKPLGVVAELLGGQS